MKAILTAYHVEHEVVFNGESYIRTENHIDGVYWNRDGESGVADAIEDDEWLENEFESIKP
jgi:hypothetical protein